MKVYHIGSKYAGGTDVQSIFVASDDSKGVNQMKEIYAQIIVEKKTKHVQIHVPKDWTVRIRNWEDNLQT